MTILQVTKEMTDFFPAVLKFGITGLSAIVFLLAYFLLRTQNKKDRPNASMLKVIKSFMWIALVFSLLSATSSFVEGFYIKKAITYDNEKDVRTGILVELATEKVWSYYNQISLKHQINDNTVSKEGDWNSENKETKENKKETKESKITIPKNKFQESKADGKTHFVESELKEKIELQQPMTQEEFNFRVLKQAIFRSIYSFGADKVILDSILLRIEYREKLDPKIADLIKIAFGELLIEKFHWLKNEVMPAMEKVSREERSKQEEKGLNRNYGIQLPKSVWIFDNYPTNNIPTMLLSEYSKDEIMTEFELLKKSIK